MHHTTPLLASGMSSVRRHVRECGAVRSSRRRRVVPSAGAKKRAGKEAPGSEKAYARATLSDGLKFDPTKSLSDVLAARDAVVEKRAASSGNDWASSLAAFRDESAAKDRRRAEMGAEIAEQERFEEEEADLIDTVWVNEAGSIAKRQFRGLAAGEEEVNVEDEAEFMAFSGEDDEDDEDVWGPRAGGEDDFIDMDDSDVFEAGGREDKLARGLPREMRCFDTAKIYIKAGDGGDGAVAFRREKFVPQGGPSGGNGGIGGSVYVVADKNMSSLDGFRKKVHHRAEPGKSGLGSKCAGRNGNDMEILVPPGTIVRDSRTKKILTEVTRAGQRVRILAGGRGGRGNASFKTAKNKAPMIAELGEQGSEFWAELELKLVADVGIIGIPNAGKSTLLASVSAAKPKIADYPFTTIVPNLGVVERDYERMVFADIPGLLEGASEGIGLGFEFLRHTKRTRVLIHVIDCTSEDCFYAYDAIRTELELFDEALLDKPEVVALNKVDDIEATERALRMKEKFDAEGVISHCVSAVTGEGMNELLNDVQAAIRALPPIEDEWDAEIANSGVRAADGKSIQQFKVTDTPYAFVVEGEAIERFTQMTNWDYFESYKRFGRVLEMSGIDAALNAAGAGEGDRVTIGNFEFEWSKDKRDRTLFETFRQRVADAPGAPRGSRHWPHAN
jgi:GTP-binding protein